MVRLIALCSVLLSAAAFAEGEPATTTTTTVDGGYRNVALVGAGISNLSFSGGPALEHRFTTKLTGILGVGLSFSSNTVAVTGLTSASQFMLYASPGIRYYLGERAFEGFFVGANLPLSFQWSGGAGVGYAQVGIGVTPEVGASIRFDRFIIQLEFGLGFSGRLPVGYDPRFGSPYTGGTTLTVNAGTAFGYAF